MGKGADEDRAGFSAELIGQSVDPGETGHLDWREPAKAPRGGMVELTKEFGRVLEQRIPASIFPTDKAWHLHPRVVAAECTVWDVSLSVPCRVHLAES